MCACMCVCMHACMCVVDGWGGEREWGGGGRGGVGGGCKTTLKCWNSGQKGSLQNKIFKV